MAMAMCDAFYVSLNEIMCFDQHYFYMMTSFFVFVAAYFLSHPSLVCGIAIFSQLYLAFVQFRSQKQKPFFGISDSLTLFAITLFAIHACVFFF